MISLAFSSRHFSVVMALPFSVVFSLMVWRGLRVTRQRNFRASERKENPRFLKNQPSSSRRPDAFHHSAVIVPEPHLAARGVFHEVSVSSGDLGGCRIGGHGADVLPVDGHGSNLGEG